MHNHVFNIATIAIMVLEFKMNSRNIDCDVAVVYLIIKMISDGCISSFLFKIQMYIEQKFNAQKSQ